MPYTAVRELTRVATRDTEQEWIDACRGRSVHEVERAVSGHAKGSRPSDPAEPDLATRTLSFEDIMPATIALLRQARQKAQEERGVHLTDNDLLAVVLGAFIEGNGVDAEQRAGRARFQIGMVLCERCDQGWQEGGGRRFAMEKADVDRAKCDAQYIGSLDGEPTRATQDVPPRVRRFVFRRDGGKCSLPGCRSAANLEIHHILPRSRGGSHDPAGLIQLCDSCHSAHHRGQIEISGTAKNLAVKRQYLFNPVEPVVAVEKHAHVGVTEACAHVGAADLRTDAVGHRAHAVEPRAHTEHAGATEDVGVAELRAEPDAHAIEPRADAVERRAHAVEPRAHLAVTEVRAHRCNPVWNEPRSGRKRSTHW
jgi:hypothetical protein